MNTLSLKAFVVNLESAKARREAVLARLAAFPALDIEIYPAVYGKDIPADQKATLVHPSFARRNNTNGVADGELGCAMSHHNVHGTIVQRGLRVALVLEDDVLVAPSFQEVVLVSADFLSRTSKPAVVLLSNRTVCLPRPVLVAANGHSLHRALFGLGTYGYLINKEGARLLSGCMFPLRVPCDGWYEFALKGLDLYAVIPHVASYTDDRSDSAIDDERHRLWQQRRRKSRPRLYRWIPHDWNRRLRLKWYKTFHGARYYPKQWP